MTYALLKETYYNYKHSALVQGTSLYMNELCIVFHVTVFTTRKFYETLLRRNKSRLNSFRIMFLYFLHHRVENRGVRFGLKLGKITTKCDKSLIFQGLFEIRFLFKLLTKSK